MIALCGPHSQSRIKYTEAKHPLLEEAVPSFLTALYVVGIGCDVLPSGVSGVTAFAILREIKKMQEQEGGVLTLSQRGTTSSLIFI